jgi:hypothetical protein
MIHKYKLYKQEQENILDRLENILDFTEDRKEISLYHLDNDDNKQRRILDLLPDIRKYFALSKSNVVNYPDTYQRPYSSIIRILLRQRYHLRVKEIKIRTEETLIRSRKYIFYT